MTRTILFDSGPLGLVTNPRATEQTVACMRWLTGCRIAGAKLVVPEIVDYELRRELIRAGRIRGVDRLDALIRHTSYLSITTAAMRRAASPWADARRAGRPTAADAALDIDVILAAQAATMAGEDVVVATTNVEHLARYVPAAHWSDIAA